MGGFSDISAAANYAGSGGIPLATLVEGGKVTAIQKEHVWVEAGKNGSGDESLPL